MQVQKLATEEAPGLANLNEGFGNPVDLKD